MGQISHQHKRKLPYQTEGRPFQNTIYNEDFKDIGSARSSEYGAAPTGFYNAVQELHMDTAL